MIRYTHYKTGAAFGIRYEFEKAGDSLPTHAHGASDAHNVIVLRGTAIVVLEGEPVAKTLVAGDLYDFDGAKRHTVVAAVPGTITFHLFLHGQPEGYDRLPPSETSGTYIT